jgi:hypothetical protein
LLLGPQEDAGVAEIGHGIYARVVPCTCDVNAPTVAPGERVGLAAGVATRASVAPRSSMPGWALVIQGSTAGNSASLGTGEVPVGIVMIARRYT